MSDKREMDEFAIYNNVSPLISNFYPLTSNLHLHIFTGKSIRFPPFSNIHVGNLKSPRGYFLFSTWASFISSEVSFDSSEEFFISYLGNKNFPRGNFKISKWKSLFSNTAQYRYVASSKLLQRVGIEFAQIGVTHHNRSVMSCT